MASSVRLTAAILALVAPVAANAGADADWAVHGQATFVEQYHPAFHSLYGGLNSLAPQNVGDETFDATLFLGIRPWTGGEIWADPEVDQGFGLSDTLGVAGFPSGEAYKVGKATPYVRLQRLFFRQTFDLGGEIQTTDGDANQFAGAHTADKLVLTAGKISVTDIFDTDSYAHDPKADFLNWSVIDAGAFDYAADAWGYSYGAAAEWTKDSWTLRGGLFDLSRVPNSTELQRAFGQFEAVAEVESRYSLGGVSGKAKLLGFINRARMGSYSDAVRLAEMTGTEPATALVRRYTSRPGAALNLEQELTHTLGMFARISINDGSKEAYEFTEINRSGSLGLSLKGADWARPKDTVGIAAVVNALSSSAQRYFADGGLGILIGDGKLRNYGTEDIVESYYSAHLTAWLSGTADYQFVLHPAYNRDRGPVSVLGVRLHAEF
jgi:high affinity Mn2+ porin